MESLKTFLKLADRIRELTDDAKYDAPLVKARALPAGAVGSVKRLRISVDSGWSSDKMTAEERDSAQRAFDIIREEKRAVAEREKRRLLAEYSRELESLRAVIVQSAAAASIDIGVVARGLAKEAEG